MTLSSERSMVMRSGDFEWMVQPPGRRSRRIPGGWHGDEFEPQERDSRAPLAPAPHRVRLGVSLRRFACRLPRRDATFDAGRVARTLHFQIAGLDELAQPGVLERVVGDLAGLLRTQMQHLAAWQWHTQRSHGLVDDR